MKKLFAALKRAPKRTTALFAVFGAVLVPAMLFAWGPNRQTFTMANPAPYVTFDSITDNPAVGDERNFVRIKPANAATYGDNVTLQPGQDYTVMVYYHNDAASNLDASGVGVAHNVAMRVQMPNQVAAGSSVNVDGVISASNANPTSVWDNATLTNSTNGAMGLSYVANSAVIHNNGATNGTKLPGNLYTTGTPLGFNSLDGTLPGCTQYSGYVTFNVHVDQPNFTVTKTVSVDGTNYAKQETAQAGQTVHYEIVYKNTGTMQQDNVVVKDTLPAGVTYVPGTTYLSSSATGNQWKSDIDGITSTGLNIGSAAPGGAVYLAFKAQVAGNDALPQCGPNNLINTATAETQNGNKSDTAALTVTKTCASTVTACNTQTGVIQQVPQGSENTPPYTTDLSKCTKVSACNTTTGEIVQVLPSQQNVAPYTSDLTKCAKVPACNTQTGVIEQVLPSQQNVAPHTSDLTQCTKVPACNTETGVIEQVLPSQQNIAPHTTDMNKCTKVQVCDTATKQTVTVTKDQQNVAPYTTDFSKCATTPVTPSTPSTPSELPHTGASDVVASLIGAGSLIAAVTYYIMSRRALNN